MSQSCSDPAPGQMQLRAMSAVTIFFGFLMMCIDAGATNYLSNYRPGAWWAAVLILITASFSSCSSNRCLVVTACVFSIFAIILGIIGCFADGGANSIVRNFQACTDNQGNNYGNSLSFDSSINCASNFTGFDCNCVTSSFSSTNDLKNSVTGCYALDFQGSVPSASCLDLMCVDGKCHHYPSLLGAATAFDVFGLFAVFALSITTCCSLCCPASLGATAPQFNNEGLNPNPTVVVVGQASNPYAPAAYAPAAPTYATPAYATTGQYNYNGNAPPVVVYATASQPKSETFQ